MAAARVLFVDPGNTSLAGFAPVLAQQGGYEVEVFETAVAAETAAGASPPDAVIAVLALAESDQVACLARMRARDPDLVWMWATREGDLQATACALDRAGPLFHVRLPPLATDILAKLEAALERRQLARALRSARAEIEGRDLALKASHREVQRATAELQSTHAALASTHSELAAATERLVKAEQLAAVGRVMTGIARELERQLALVGYAEAIKSRVRDDRELCEFADVIVNAQKRLLALVDEIRDFAAGEMEGAAGGGLRCEPADVAAVVADAVAILQYDPDVRRRRIECHYRSRPLAALHRHKFSQVVINLVSNAVLATKPEEAITLELDHDRRQGRAVLTVSDRGVGMPPEVLARLGEPFFTTRGDRGSGLGVGICRRIVEEHGGQLTFRSQVGQGTTATVTVPALAEETEPQAR